MRMINLDSLIDDMKKIRYFCGKDGNDLELFEDEKQILFDYFEDIYELEGIEMNFVGSGYANR